LEMRLMVALLSSIFLALGTMHVAAKFSPFMATSRSGCDPAPARR
jgi:hypothetical protein